MRSTLPAFLLSVAVLALAGVGASQGLAEPGVEVGSIVVQAPPALPSALPTPSPALGGGEPADVPQVTGAMPLVARAAAALHDGSSAEAAVLAAEQHLRAAVQPAGTLGWTLARFLPPAPLAPAAMALPAPSASALGAPARAAVAAVSVASLVAVAMPKVPLLPLYSRIEREEAMLNSRRAQLYELVMAEPGIHLSDLVRRSGLGWGAALYHLSVLERSRVIVPHQEGGFKRYFVNGHHARAEVPRLAALRHGAAKALFDEVLAQPGRSGRELAMALGLSPSSLARASDRLEQAGLVRRVRAGRRVLYFPAEPVRADAVPAPAVAVAA